MAYARLVDCTDGSDVSEQQLTSSARKLGEAAKQTLFVAANTVSQAKVVRWAATQPEAVKILCRFNTTNSSTVQERLVTAQKQAQEVHPVASSRRKSSCVLPPRQRRSSCAVPSDRVSRRHSVAVRGQSTQRRTSVSIQRRTSVSMQRRTSASMQRRTSVSMQRRTSVAFGPQGQQQEWKSPTAGLSLTNLEEVQSSFIVERS